MVATAWMKAVDAGSGQRAEAVASAWAATSAVGAGEAVAVAECWLVDVGVATTGGGVMLVRQQCTLDQPCDMMNDLDHPIQALLMMDVGVEMKTEAFGKMDGRMGSRRKRLVLLCL
ncbi:hypothetical protein ACLOJK_014968 [Asimina triloba]